MIDNKKEQERAELHRTIWGIANDLRGSVDGWDFKNYVLVMLFYRYISENLTNYINAGEIEAGYEPAWIPMDKAIEVFGDYERFHDSNIADYGLYRRENLALLAYKEQA